MSANRLNRLRRRVEGSSFRFIDLTIQLASLHDAIHQLYREYRSGGTPCFAVQVSFEATA